jgi:SH3-like domain-containing protein
MSGARIFHSWSERSLGYGQRGEIIRALQKPALLLIKPHYLTSRTASSAEVAASFRPKAQLSTLRQVVDSEGFDDKRGWRRILALWGATNAPFSR